MKLTRALIFCSVTITLLCYIVPATAQTNPLQGAQWIWYPPNPGETTAQYPAASGYFRKSLSILESPSIKSAYLTVSCDNLFVLYLNGQPIAESSTDPHAWKQPRRYNLKRHLIPGNTVIAIEAINTLPGAAGLIAKLELTFEDGTQQLIQTDDTWKCSPNFKSNWEQNNFDHQQWQNAHTIAPYGEGLWKALDPPKLNPIDPDELGKVHALMKNDSNSSSLRPTHIQPDPNTYPWPQAIIYVTDDCSLNRPAQNTGDSAMDSLSVTIFNPRNSRSFPEHDLPAPMKVGRKLMRYTPGQDEPTLLLDSGQGALGSPSVAYDGNWIYFSMVPEGDAFFHLYRIAAQGGTPEQLTDGPFFDIEPAELPDGRIVFVSTRVGTFEEYHSPPARALHVMQPDGTDITPITNTIIFDNEPEVMADGRILFIRSDNFFDRGKVETLLHAILPDGTSGYTEFGLDNGPEYGNRLRANYVGSPAPMPDGRVAFLSNAGITIGRSGHQQQHMKNITLNAGDVAPLPDGRLLCTLGTQQKGQLLYDQIAILQPDAQPPIMTTLLQNSGEELHSPVFLGPRPRPPLRKDLAKSDPEQHATATGFLFCQDARFTKNTTAGWDQVRAIRVLAGKGLTTRSSHSYIVHQGNETIELGTVPLSEDGSFFIEVPADTPLALQAVDAEGRSELNEMSWIYVRPGERRSCVGCHQPRQVAPLTQATRAFALDAPPLKLLGQGKPHHYRGNNAAVTGLMELQFDRFREVAGINRYESAHHDELADLIAQLEGDDTHLKISATQRLALFRNPASAPALATCLTDPSRELRVAATVALAACGNRDSVPPLLKALYDEDVLVAQGAAMALENLTAHYEAGTPETRAQAWNSWFENTSWDAIEKACIVQLASDDKNTIRKAAVAISHTGSLESRKALRKYVFQEKKDNPYPRWQRKGNKGDNARFNSQSEVNPRTLQAATRAIGAIQDQSAVSMLADILEEHSHPRKGNLFLAEAAAEALGRIPGDASERALVEAFAALKDYPDYTLWYGDHPALMSCHASPIHYFILQALYQRRTTQAEEILPHIIRSVPIDPDRALLLENDDYENLVGALLRQHNYESIITETCLSILGDPDAKADRKIKDALAHVIRCWAGHPSIENRAAQILSMTCRDHTYAPRIEKALLRYCTQDSGIERVFNTGIPVVDALPTENWVSFYLARTLGYLKAPSSATQLTTILTDAQPEAAKGRPDPLGPGVLFLHNGLTPCWRAAVAWALGELGDPGATPILLRIVNDFDNATDTRHAAATALGKIADTQTKATLTTLAKDYPERSIQLALFDAAQEEEEQ